MEIENEYNIFKKSAIFEKCDMEYIMEEFASKIRPKIDIRKKDKKNIVEINKEEGVTMGYIYLILIKYEEPLNILREMIINSKDKLIFVSKFLDMIIIDFYEYLTMRSIEMILWLVENLIAIHIPCIENVLISLIRYIVVQVTNTEIEYLSTNIIRIIRLNKEWIASNEHVMNMILYSLLRMVCDKYEFDNVYNDCGEMELCVYFLTNHFDKCINIGRDLIRCLQVIGHIDKYKDIIDKFKGICNNSSYCTKFKDKTSYKLFISRIPPKIEHAINFYLQIIPIENKNRYDYWLFCKYFNKPHMRYVISDVIRYILNESKTELNVLKSNIIYIILTIYSGNKCIPIHIKYSLFFDFFLYNNNEKNNSIDIVGVTLHTLSEYRSNIFNEFINYLLECVNYTITLPYLNSNLCIKCALKYLIDNDIIESLNKMEFNLGGDEKIVEKTVKCVPESLIEITIEPKENNEIQLDSEVDQITKIITTDYYNNDYMVKSLDKVTAFLSLPNDFRNEIKDIGTNSPVDERIKVIKNCMDIINKNNYDPFVIKTLSRCLKYIISSDHISPISLSSDNITYDFNYPGYFILKNCKADDGKFNRKILELIKSLYELDERYGYHILFYMTHAKGENISNYKKILCEFGYNPFTKYLYIDINNILLTDRNAYHKIILNVIDVFHQDIYNNSEFIVPLCKSIDFYEANYIINRIKSKSIKLINISINFYIFDYLEKLPYISMIFLWRMYLSENPPLSNIFNYITKMDWLKNSEELNLCYEYISTKTPSSLLLEEIFSSIAFNNNIISNDHHLFTPFMYSVCHVFKQWVVRSACLSAFCLSLASYVVIIINDLEKCHTLVKILTMVLNYIFDDEKIELLKNAHFKQFLYKIHEKYSANSQFHQYINTLLIST